MRKRTLYAEVNDNGICNTPSENFSSVVLVANTQKTAIRIAEISDVSRIHEVFPIGEKMNENTHVFAGSKFVNDDMNMSCVMCVALPFDFADTATREAANMFGSVYALDRLETIEHILFRHYAALASEPMWVLLPQGDGLRILHTVWNLPRDTYTISNHPDLRQHELERTWSDAQNAGITPERVVLLGDNIPSDWGWALRFFADKNTPIEVEGYALEKFISKY